MAFKKLNLNVKLKKILFNIYKKLKRAFIKILNYFNDYLDKAE